MKLIKINTDHYVVVDNSGKQVGWKLDTAYVKELIGEVDVEKKYTEEDIESAIRYGMGLCLEKKDWAFGISGSCKQYLKGYIKSLPKTVWEVEIVDGKLKLK